MKRDPSLLDLAVALPLAGLVATGCAGEQTSGNGPEADASDLPPSAAPPAAEVECDEDDGGLDLPEGFCATVVARDVGRTRHLAVDDDGDLYVAVRGSRDGDAGGVVALRDTTGDARADVTRRIVEDRGGTGMAIRDGHIYYGRDDGVLRWELPADGLVPDVEPETVVQGLRGDGGHAAKPLAFDGEGNLYVNVGAPSNACQEESRSVESPGQDPCPELEENGGIWVFDADGTGQSQDDGERWATGMRNTVALGHNPLDGHLYAAIHGRDQLSELWPDLYTEEERAEKPSEEFVRVTEDADFGWPYCFHDPELDEKVLAPEYGGDGEEVGRCAEKDDPLLAFPAHWGPNDLHFYTGDQFPERYRAGAFLAFHGSWNRAPLPQEGYNVVFVPFDDGEPAGDGSEFATGFRESGQGPADADHRPTGLTQGPDGSLYVTDDQSGWIWRIVHRGS